MSKYQEWYYVGWCCSWLKWYVLIWMIILLHSEWFGLFAAAALSLLSPSLRASQVWSTWLAWSLVYIGSHQDCLFHCKLNQLLATPHSTQNQSEQTAIMYQEVSFASNDTMHELNEWCCLTLAGFSDILTDQINDHNTESQQVTEYDEYTLIWIDRIDDIMTLQ